MAKELKYVMLLDCYGDLLTEHQRSVMELYYCEDLSLAEIGSPLGITRQAVMSLIKRTEAILLNYEEKLGFVQRFGKMKNCVSNISDTVGNINDPEIREKLMHELSRITELL